MGLDKGDFFSKEEKNFNLFFFKRILRQINLDFSWDCRWARHLRGLAGACITQDINSYGYASCRRNMN